MFSRVSGAPGAIASTVSLIVAPFASAVAGQVTTPPTCVAPRDAERKLTSGGSVSLTTTSVAEAVPRFRVTIS